MKLLCFLIALFAILAVSSAAEVSTIKCCPENSFYTRCGSRCPPSCSRPSAGFCIPECVEACQCRDGWLVSNGKCVLPSQCPPASPIVIIED